MRRLALLTLGLLLGAALPASAQNWITVNGTSQLSASSSGPGVAIRQSGAGPAWCVQSPTTGANLWCVDKNGVVTSTVAAQTFAVSGIAATSTNALTLANTTASTASTTVQMSPNLKWTGSAYNSTSGLSENDSFFAEVLPATNAGTTTATWKLNVSINGGASTTPFMITNAGATTISGGLVASGSLTGGINITTTSNTGVIGWANRGFIGTPADGLLSLTNNAITVGPQVNTGTAAPTVTTCGTGAPTAHSTNTAGEITPTGATACTVTFGAPNWTNQPFCTITVEAATVTAFISAISVLSFTVSALASGEKFMYVCFGGV